MSDKKVYTKAQVDEFAQAVKRECEKTLLLQRERIDELKTALKKAEDKIAEYEGQKDIIYKAITAALKKADDIERVSLIRYNQEIAQLRSFHDRWVGYFNRIVAKYPLDDELVEAGKVNGKIIEVLKKTGDIEAQYESEKNRLVESVKSEKAEKETAAAIEKATKTDDYADRSPAGFSFAEALHPKEDLKDIMRELGVIFDE
ncbi:MAG: hypothetical protein J1G38_05555 [Clostridiales bacterium]|nr:hypothetical protein [Clostridiales bacterium]